jgi:DNA repair exonuclease SbcCD ATPase subunit
MCYEKGFIDFTEFSTALIIGKKENSDMYSNGVGKTCIFQAMEYVLFNQSIFGLERIVRDDTNSCKVVLDFFIGDQEYRLSRSRTRKGTTDLTLLQRTTQDGSTEEVYHSALEVPWIDKKHTEKFWKDLSGSRAGDTEKDLSKLIKIGHKAFRSTILFPQRDTSGLATATPNNRKGILKEALNLIVYSKLEKIAKEKASILIKEYDKNKVLLDNLGEPTLDIINLNAQLAKTEQIIEKSSASLLEEQSILDRCNEEVNQLTHTYSDLESKFTSLLVKEKSILAEKNRIEISVKEYASKKANVLKSAKEMVEEINTLKETQVKLIKTDFCQIDILTEQVNKLKEEITHHNISIKNNIEKYEELKIPVPDDAICKHCRQVMTDEHKKSCKDQIAQDMAAYQESIQNSKRIINALNKEILVHQQTVNSLSLSKQQLEGVNMKLTAKNKEMIDKKALHEEYVILYNKFTTEAEEKIKELEFVQEELKNSSLEEANQIKKQIEIAKQNALVVMTRINPLNKEIAHYNASKAVLQHTIDQKGKDKLKQEDLKKVLEKINTSIGVYPSVIQAFSSTGIPNLIIQNILDDLQIEANSLLNQIKPGLQLSFSVEKTVEKTGDQADTLDINYQINGKDRYYEQLSGAMQVAVMFSLKIGLSFLLQKMIGVDIKFLLLDEIDAALDKASIDAFADIVKFFQKDFTILIITHNDRLKDKFSHAILVDQDINMISKARVVSSW